MHSLCKNNYTSNVMFMIKRIIVDTIIVMALGYLLHGIYDMWPNVLTSVIAPVNESIWEHGKLTLLSFILLYPIDRLFFKHDRKSFSSTIITALICICLTYLIFTPVFLYILKTNDNMVVTISIYVICVLISLIINEKYILKHFIDNYSIGIVLSLGLLIVFGILTYNPFKKPIFYDYKNQVYGIDINP